MAKILIADDEADTVSEQLQSLGYPGYLSETTGYRPVARSSQFLWFP